MLRRPTSWWPVQAPSAALLAAGQRERRLGGRSGHLVQRLVNRGQLRVDDGGEGRSSSPRRLHRAIALRYVAGPAAALSEVDTLTGDLDDYHPIHTTRAELLRDLDRADEARAADQRAPQRSSSDISVKAGCGLVLLVLPEPFDG